MKTVFRISRDMVEEIKADLQRPHPIAFERVGFVYVKRGSLDKDLLLIASSYFSVKDEHYKKPKEGEYAGAVISRYAITEAMQRALSTGDGVFHIHMHDYSLKFSGVDKKSQSALMPSFYHVSPVGPHGALLLSSKGIAGCFWTIKGKLNFLSKISVVGYPCEYYEVKAI